MSHYLFAIRAVFQFQECGLAIFSDVAIKDAAAMPMKLSVGDAVQICCTDGTTITTQIKGIEWAHPFNPDATQVFLLPSDVAERSNLVGAEAWSVVT